MSKKISLKWNIDPNVKIRAETPEDMEINIFATLGRMRFLGQNRKSTNHKRKILKNWNSSKFKFSAH